MRLALLGLLALSCYRETYPCDAETGNMLVASCRAKYEECRLAGHTADCPATDECRKVALEREVHCSKHTRASSGKLTR